MARSIQQCLVFMSDKQPQKIVQIADDKLDIFVGQVVPLFETPLQPWNLLSMSRKLQKQFIEKLQSSSICMLPSYNYTLPRGDEMGKYLSLDVGGSTLRIALVDLVGRTCVEQPMRISRMDTWRIDDSVRVLKGQAFFDWIAERIDEMLSKSKSMYTEDAQPLPLGVAWSFPLEQTSTRSAALLGMGKGFLAADDVLGQDLGDLIMRACKRWNLNVRMDAVINDCSATLLARAYLDQSTRFALIVGTGINAAIHLPVTALGPDKLGHRPQSWHEKAKRVVINVELSMFGKSILVTTRWDEHLNATHLLPDFQPFEQLVGGRYLGEIVRLILVEAVQTAGLFHGDMPDNLLEPYSLDTATMGIIEADETPSLYHACQILETRRFCSTTPTYAELVTIQRICACVSHRAAAYLASGIHALWSIRNEAEGLMPSTAGRVSVGCNGSVVEKYPGFGSTCQRYIDAVCDLSGADSSSVLLEPAIESALFGAAVAVSCVESENA